MQKKQLRSRYHAYFKNAPSAIEIIQKLDMIELPKKEPKKRGRKPKQ